MRKRIRIYCGFGFRGFGLVVFGEIWDCFDIL
jgi:hypothetical protein